MDEGTQSYRRRYRSESIPAGYSGTKHAITVVIVGTLLCAAPWVVLQGLAPVRILMIVALTLVTASLTEYVVHRFVMHRPVPGLRAIDRRHSLQHHRFFTDRDGFLEELRDLHVTLFPPLLLALFALITFVLAAIVAVLFSIQTAGVFFSTCIGYYIAYEAIHASAHLQRVGSGRPRWLTKLNSAHQLHHDPRRMRSFNFNIVIPIGDWLFRTYRSDRACPAGHTARRESLLAGEKDIP